MTTPAADSAPPAGDRAFPGRSPSGLFPAGPRHPRYREPHPVRAAAVAAGLGAGGLWMLLFGVLGTSVRSYGWLTLVCGAVAWAVALLLARIGDRGVAVGLAIGIGVTWAIATLVIASTWAAQGWPLW